MDESRNPPPDAASDDAPSSTGSSRVQLLWDVIVFQFKLAADGLRDLFLSPLSIISALFGMVAGGDQPDRYFRSVLRFGRRSEVWINLFGHRKHAGTSDEFIAPLKDKVMAEAERRPWVGRVGSDLNRRLDDVNANIARRAKPKSDAQDDL